jgi:hypothetical protein
MACSALILAACGGDAGERRTSAAPTIQRPVARQLAGRSDEVARLLDSGDDCGALAESNRLRGELARAINRQLIPQRYRQDLSAAVEEIRGQIVCRPPPPPPPPPPPDEDNGKKKGKKHDKKHGDHDGDHE